MLTRESFLLAPNQAAIFHTVFVSNTFPALLPATILFLNTRFPGELLGVDETYNPLARPAQAAPSMKIPVK